MGLIDTGILIFPYHLQGIESDNDLVGPLEPIGNRCERIAPCWSKKKTN
jgi:hypothetical protein